MSARTPFAGIRHLVDAKGGSQRFCARDKRAVLYLASLLLDCLSLVAGYFIARTIREGEWLDAVGHSIIVIALPLFLMLTVAREVQSVESLESRTIAVRRSFGALAATALAILGLTFLLQADEISRLGFGVMFAAAAGLILLGKLAIDKVFHHWMHGSAIASLLLIDGLCAETDGPMDVVDIRSAGLRPNLSDPKMMDALSRLVAPYDRVVVACEFEDRGKWATFLKGHDVGGEILLDRDILQGAVAIGAHGSKDTLVLSRGPLSMASRIQKRAFDLVVATVALLLLGPLMIVVAALVKLESPGPVLFRQTRVGEGNRQFKIFKFRSMRFDASDSDGHVSAQRGDSRVTRVGAFIRRTSIDELPQLFNVLSGDMSIVGPRPHALGSLAGENLFWEVSKFYWTRHALKPGITGLAQVRGLRGATETSDDLTQRVRADLEYLSNWSLPNDILIILRTIRVLMHRKAY